LVARKWGVEDILAERFWSKVERGRDCWVWQGSRVAPGYGTIKLEDRL
jgi:hypothetical protein